MTSVAPGAAYELWSQTYDSDPNPLLALERRLLAERLALSTDSTVLDLGTGTGWWVQHALSRQTLAFGMDISGAMLAEAAKKPGVAGRLVLGHITRLPFADDSADLAICSFALSYVADAAGALAEMARVSRRVIFSDLHPAAEHAGWSRSFRAAGSHCQIEHYPRELAELETAARAAGLRPSWTMEAGFGEPEREIFVRAGRGDRYSILRNVPAVLISAWERG